MRALHLWPTALLLALAVSCGGRHDAVGPTGLGGTTPAAAQFVNGLSPDEAVPGLVVAVNGVALPQCTGADGRTAEIVSNGARVSTSARPDFFDRDTRFSAQAPTLALWPLTSAYGSEYYRTIVYDYSGGDKASTQWDYLMRPRAGSYSVSVDAALRGDPVAYHWVNVALEEATRITHGKVTFRWVEGGGDVSFELNPQYPGVESAWGLCDTRYSGQFISGARIVLQNTSAARSNTIVHELGHFLGLQHSDDLRDVMSVRARNYQQLCFTPGEESAWLMMVQREPGNRFPDRDPGLAGAGMRPAPPAIACGR